MIDHHHECDGSCPMPDYPLPEEESAWDLVWGLWLIIGRGVLITILVMLAVVLVF